MSGVIEITKGPVSRFDDLDVWQKSFRISVVVHKESLNFPKFKQYALADQIRRASKSICANIAEGFSRQSGSKAEFKRFLQMALGSANEMLVWIRYCKELNYVSSDVYSEWEAEYDSICRMLNALKARS